MFPEQSHSEAQTPPANSSAHSRGITRLIALLPALLLAVLLPLVSACSSLKPEQLSPPFLSSRKHYVNAEDKQSPASATKASARGLAQWWRVFEEPELNSLLEKAFIKNPDVRVAMARLGQARAQRDQARASLWPSLGLGGAVTRTKRNVGTFNLGQGSSSSASVISTTYAVSAPLQYEVDIWGRIRNEAQAAAFAENASYAELQSVGLSITAEIAEQYFVATELCQQLALLDATIRADQAFYELVLSRYKDGIGDALDVYQAAQNLSTRRSGRPTFVANLVAARNQLHVLVGEYPEAAELCDAKDFPAVTHGISPEVPADLLLRRPDVSAALLRLQASDQQLTAAIKAWLPGLSLSASGGYESLEFSDLFSPETLVWRILGEASFAIFDGGFRNAQIAFQRELMAERDAQVLKVLLAACADVENALKQRETISERLKLLEVRKAAVSRTLRLSTEQYLQGIRDYLPILVSQGTLYAVQSELLQAKRELVSNYIQTARALGGDWRFDAEGTMKKTDDAEAAAQPKVLSARIQKGAI